MSVEVPPVAANGAAPGAAPPTATESGVKPALVAAAAGPPVTAAEVVLSTAEDEQPLDDEEAEYEDERARVFLAGGAYATVAIDRYDDLPAIFGKIDTAASPRVALVAKRGNRELQRALSMRRLQRHLDLHGKELILVTRSRALRMRAREEELPAVGSLGRVNFQNYGRPGLHLGWLTLRLPSAGGLLGLLVLAAAVIGGLAVLLWYVPTGTVTVFLPVTPQEDVLELALDGQASAVNPEKGIVPAKRRELVVTRSFYRPATGVVQIPTNNAAVALRFTNRTNAALRVPKGTVVIADNGTRFTTGNDIDLPRVNATADVVALAQTPGTVGNVPANSIRRIEGDIGFRAAVANPTPGEKGTDTPQQVVAEADREGVRDFADAVLLDAAQQELRQRFAETATLFPSSASVTVIEVVASPPVGAPGKYTEVKVTGRVSMLTADDSDLRQVYANVFRPRIGPNEMLVDEEFKTAVEGTGAPDPTTDRLPVTLRAQTATAPYLDKGQIRTAIAGKSKTAAARVIRDRVASPTAPQISTSPGWAPRLPRMADRISVSFAAAR